MQICCNFACTLTRETIALLLSGDQILAIVPNLLNLGYYGRAVVLVGRIFFRAEGLLQIAMSGHSLSGFQAASLSACLAAESPVQVLSLLAMRVQLYSFIVSHSKGSLQFRVRCTDLHGAVRCEVCAGARETKRWSWRLVALSLSWRIALQRPAWRGVRTGSCSDCIQKYFSRNYAVQKVVRPCLPKLRFLSLCVVGSWQLDFCLPISDSLTELYI